MAVEIDVEYKGDLRTRATHGPSGATLDTAPPADNQGDGSAFSPTDLLATALATCTLTIMAIAAKKHGIDFAGATAHVEKHMSLDPPRRIARLPIAFRMPRGIAETYRERLERAALTCPVNASLSPDVEVDLTFIWPQD